MSARTVPTGTMRILFVADPYSVHTARWIAQLKGTGWDIHLFDPMNGLIHDQLEGVHVYTGWKKSFVPKEVGVSYRWPFLRGRHFLERRCPWLWRAILPEAGLRLARLVDRLKPDCLHTLGLQKHGTALLQARQHLGGELPAPWIYSCRGSDIYYYRQFPEQDEIIRGVVEGCQFYMCNCRRDVRLAEEYGLRGELLGLFQGGGGFAVDDMRKKCRPGPVSQRRVIAVKGLQTRYGNARVAVEALRQCAPNLEGYRLKFYQAHAATREAVHRLAEETGLEVEIIPRTSHRDICALFGEARVAVGISSSDGIPNSMIEAMIMGAFPIQTNPGGASAEWIEDGVNGILVPDDDPDAVAAAISEALVDDAKVDAAAETNPRIARERVDLSRVRPLVIDAYRRIAKTS